MQPAGDLSASMAPTLRFNGQVLVNAAQLGARCFIRSLSFLVFNSGLISCKSTHLLQVDSFCEREAGELCGTHGAYSVDAT